MSSTNRALHRSAILLGLSSSLAGLLPVTAEETEALAPTTVVANRILTPLAQTGSAVTVGVEPTNEEWVAARHALRWLPGNAIPA